MTRDSRALASRPAIPWSAPGPLESRDLPPAALVVGAGIALAAVQGGLASLHVRWAAAALVVAVLLFAGVYVQLLGAQAGVLALLIATTLTDRFTFPIGPLNIRAEQVALAVAVGFLVVSRLRERRLSLERPSLAEMALLLWLAVGLASSVVNAAQRFESLKVLALLAVSATAMFLPRRLFVDHPREFDTTTRWLLLAFAVEGVYALAVYFLHLLGPSVSMSVNRGQLAVFGTLWEPNVLGAVCAAGAIAWTFLGRLYFRRHWIGMAICASASVVTFTRAAWIALAAVLALTVLTKLRRRVDLRAIPIAALATLFVIGAVLGAERFANYYPGDAFAPTQSTRIGGAVGDRTDILGRIYQVGPVLQDVIRHPILGGGIASFGQHYAPDGAPAHVANLELALLNDTGLLGMLLFAGFALALVVATWRQSQDPLVLGLGATVLVIAITNQATETLELMITWLLLGLLTAAIAVRTPQRDRDRSQSSRYRLVT